jgi:hypothetical protein
VHLAKKLRNSLYSSEQKNKWVKGKRCMAVGELEIVWDHMREAERFSKDSVIDVSSVLFLT